MQQKHSKLLKSLANLEVLAKTQAEPQGLSLESILENLGDFSHWLVIAIFSLPFLQPIPIPGLSTISGVLIFLAGIFLLLGKQPKLPKKIANKRISNGQIEMMSRTAERIWLKIEKIMPAKLNDHTQSKLMVILHITLVWVLAFLLGLPLPIPFSNFIPALPILLIAIGFIEDNFLVILIGDLFALIAVLFFVFLAFGLNETIQIAINKFA